MNCPRCGRSISKHETGVETDACVAEVAMGLAPNRRRSDDGYAISVGDVWTGTPPRWRSAGSD